MKKFEGMLFCTDLDGTLYADDKTVSRENLEAIEYFKSEGGTFTFITGRVPKTAVSICELIRPNAPYGCINGAGIYDPACEKYLWNIFLPHEALELVHDVDASLPEIGIQLNTEKDLYFYKDNAALVRFRARIGLPKKYCDINDVRERILKILFAHEDDGQIRQLKEFLAAHPKAEKFDFIQSERTLYEILPKGASKGVALGKMAELLEIDMAKTVAVGDYYNDISMLKVAKLGFAVANAVEAAKEAADHVVASNNEHAIAKIIDGLDSGIFSL